MSARPWVVPTEDWHQIELLAREPGQRIYGTYEAERGPDGEPIAVWLYAEHLTLVYRDEPLAQYHVVYQPDQRQLQTVTPAQLFETRHRSPQQPLWTWDDDKWLPVLRSQAYAPREERSTYAVQPPLFALDEVGA